MQPPETPGPEASALRDALDRFDQAWERGEQPALEAYLSDAGALRAFLLRDLIHLDLEHRLKAGQDVRLENYLERFPDLRERPAELLSLIVSECVLRQRQTPVRLEEYLERFPTLEGELKTRLPFVVAGGEAVPPVTLPRQFGRYRIERPLGHGNMGAVFLAHDLQLDRPVALKVPFSRGPGAEEKGRFLREARSAAILHHANICPIYDAGEIDGIPYLTMAFIPGQPLTAAFPPPVEPRRASALVRQLALALEVAHRRHFLHRDLKPSNILVNDRQEPVVLDFGLARRRPAAGAEATITQPGLAVGTPAYMAPEQARGDTHLGPACDIYSLGVIFYELLAGRRPFLGSIDQVLAQVISLDPPPPRQWRPELDPKLEEVCLRAVARPVEGRFATMQEFADALGKWLEPRGPVPEPAPAAAAEEAPDPRAAQDVLRLLRDWGWEMGLRKLKAQIEGQADPAQRSGLRMLLGWLAGERGHHAEALEQLRAVEEVPGLSGWALAGQALVAFRERNYPAAGDLLQRAATTADPDDRALRGTIAHSRGTLAFHQGQDDQALGLLNDALEMLGPTHFGTGRVLDTLGMVHAWRGNFLLARTFYDHALEIKRQHDDEAGLALTRGQLGRLYLDWGLLDQADEQFRRGVELARRIGDERGEAQLYNHRAQVRLEAGRPEQALPLLEESIRSSWERWPVVEGFALKDRALALLALKEPERADPDTDRAEMLFDRANFAEGIAHVLRVRGLIRQAQGRPDEAARCLRLAAAHFEGRQEHAEAARTQRELARARHQGGAPAFQVVPLLLNALREAERGRRDRLVAGIERELGEVSEADLLRHFLGRMQGTGLDLPGGDLFSGTSLTATVLVLEWQTDTTAGVAPLDLLPLAQELDAEVAELLHRHTVVPCQYHGWGLVAVAQGGDHGRRAVAAGLAVVRHLAEFNRPRRVLGWPLWQARIGLSSGQLWIGQRGSYHKLDLTVLGPAMLQAQALAQSAQPEAPCISETTRTLLGDSGVRLAPASQRTTTGAERTMLQTSWDVLGGRERETHAG
jgi:serine/threonine protein kinase